jgi:hypothetical protein
VTSILDTATTYFHDTGRDYLAGRASATQAARAVLMLDRLGRDGFNPHTIHPQEFESALVLTSYLRIQGQIDNLLDEFSYLLGLLGDEAHVFIASAARLRMDQIDDEIGALKPQRDMLRSYRKQEGWA